MCSSNCLLAVIAIIFPPLPVWVKRGLCSADSLINLALCCLGFVPGLLHSWYIISTTPDFYEYERIVDVEAAPNGRVRHSSGTHVYYVAQGPGGGRGGPSRAAPKPAGANNGAPAPRAQEQLTYGTTNNGNAGAPGPSSNEVPPSYSEAIEGDHKVQRK